jgi:LPXTG-motif cell wall-anchored protein
MFRSLVSLLSFVVLAGLPVAAAAQVAEETGTATETESPVTAEDPATEMPNALTPESETMQSDPADSPAGTDGMLPATAGSWTTVAAIGVASLGGALALRRRRR